MVLGLTAPFPFLNVREKELQAKNDGSYDHGANDHLIAFITRIPGYRPVIFK
jgi:hypothetical protein